MRIRAAACQHGTATMLMVAPGESIAWCSACGAIKITGRGAVPWWRHPKPEPDHDTDACTLCADVMMSAVAWFRAGDGDERDAAEQALAVAVEGHLDALEPL